MFGVRPDHLGLVAACPWGFSAANSWLILGLILGCFQDMLAAGVCGSTWSRKAEAASLAGLAGRHMAHITPGRHDGGIGIISCLSSAVFLYSMNPAGLDEVWLGALDDSGASRGSTLASELDCTSCSGNAGLMIVW